MEIIPGSGNWRLILRREAEGITVLRAATCDKRAVLPETLCGLPVTALGDHALSPTAAPAEGEELLVTCGGAGDPEIWTNRDLEDLTLPRSLRRMGDYALMNCGALRTLRLHDGIRIWGAAVLMNCRSLNTLHLTREEEQGDALAWFADELPWELDVTIRETDGSLFRLIFPEYREVYEENCPAHHFDYNISGAGYPYHHSFRRKKLDLRTYDELWPGFLGMEHDAGCAVRLAFWRLRYPVELTPRAEGQYLSYLKAHAGRRRPGWWGSGTCRDWRSCCGRRSRRRRSWRPPGTWPGSPAPPRRWPCCWSSSGTRPPGAWIRPLICKREGGAPWRPRT